MSDRYPTTPTNKVRFANRGRYDKKTIFEILDAGMICHVAFVHENKPVVIPTLYGRDGDAIFVHGAKATRMLQEMSKGIDVSLCVTHVDGLVLARSGFHHSMNYRSVVVFGKATAVEDETELVRALKVISDNAVPGRWEEARGPNAREIKITSVLRIEIEEASAKIRTGPPSDEPEDYELDVWAGVVPMSILYGDPIVDPDSRKDLPIPKSVSDLPR